MTRQRSNAMVLAQRRQKPEESLQELGDVCRRLFTLAYPDAEGKLKDSAYEEGVHRNDCR